MPDFIECTSVNISYDILGVATINYTIVTDTPGLEGKLLNQIIVGTPSKTFTGYITNATMTPIPKTDWFEINATLVSTTN
jgi:hypothetical protein